MEEDDAGDKGDDADGDDDDGEDEAEVTAAPVMVSTIGERWANSMLLRVEKYGKVRPSFSTSTFHLH